MNEKREFNEMIETLVNEEIFIGDVKSDLSDEIEHNMLYIQISDDQQKIISESDLLLLIEKIINNRQQQIIDSNKNHGMYFYLWFDDQACQLRMNLISDFHEKLPFSCEHKILRNPSSIIKSFLYSEYHDGMPLVEDVEIETNQNNVLNVYLKQLP